MTQGDSNREAEDVSVTDDTSADLAAAGNESADDRYRRLLEHSPDAVCVHQHGRAVYVNKVGLRWMKAPSADAMVGAVITEFVHPEAIPAMLDRISALRKQGDMSVPTEVVMLACDGSQFEVEVVSVLTVWNGEPAYQVIFRDIAARKEAQAAVRFQAALVDHVSDAIIATTGAGVITAWNPAAEAIYGRSAAEALGLPVGEAVGAELDPESVLAGGGLTIAAHRAADGAALAVRVSAAAMDGGYVLVCSDQSALRRAEQHFQTVVSSLDEGVVVLDHAGELVSVNPAVRRILRLTDADYRLHYTEVANRWKADPDAAYVATVWPVLDTLRTGIPYHGEVYNDSPSGERRWLAVSSRRLNPDEGDRSAVLITFHDITSARNATEHFAHQALHDSLTGLPNRAHLVVHLDRLLADGGLGAVLFVDLDDFKVINDALGHDIGDQVIQVAGQRISDAVRASDGVYRLSGDEFVVLMAGPVVTPELAEVTGRITTNLEEPMSLAGLTVRVGASIGVVAVRADETRGPTALLRRADRAMYEAKARSRRPASYTTDTGSVAIAQFLPRRSVRNRS